MSVRDRHNVRVFGAGPQPMVFAHGFGCDENMWRYVAPAFAEHNTIVLFDHVGAGGSDITAYDRRKYSSLEGDADGHPGDLPGAGPLGPTAPGGRIPSFTGTSGT